MTLEIPLPPIEVQEQIIAGIKSKELENEALSKTMQENEQSITDKIAEVW